LLIPLVGGIAGTARAAGTLTLYQDAAHTIGPHVGFARNQPVYAQATGLPTAANRSFRLQVLTPAGVQVHLSSCVTGVTTADDSYLVGSADPPSAGNNSRWDYQLLQYGTNDCTGSATMADRVKFDVAVLTAYSDPGLTTPVTSVPAGSIVHVVVEGMAENRSDLRVSWYEPDGTLSCANTTGGDIPNSGPTGRDPETATGFIQYPPNTTATGDSWNQEGKYEIAPCADTVIAGQWQLGLGTPGQLHSVTLDAFSVSSAASITIRAPADGATYSRYMRIPADYTCFDPDGVASCSGPTGFFDTNTRGAKDFTVTMTDDLGNVTSATSHFSVVNPCLLTPTIVLGPGGGDGTPGDDVIRAVQGDVVVDAGGGNDVVCTGPGNDVVDGGEGSDVVLTRDGTDTLDGGLGPDYLEGDHDGDTIGGAGGDDRLEGKSGQDTLRGGAGGDDVDGGYGNDVLHSTDGVSGNDQLNGGSGTNTCESDPGDVVTNC
jgi:hypothetical protein